MKILSTKHEILNKFKYSNVSNFQILELVHCLAFRNLNLGFVSERSK